MYKKRNDSYEDDFSEAAWDLRQIRAKFISLDLLAIDEATRKKNYIEWVRNVKLLYKRVNHYVKKKVKDFEDQYSEKLKALTSVVNKYPTTFLGNNNKPEAIWEIENKIFDLEMCIYDGMEESGLWGTKNEDLSGL